jgi:hypothetical protein
MEQRRHFFRVLFKAPVTLRWSAGEATCALRDLSLKGALVCPATPFRLAAGTPCRLELPLGADRNDCIAMDGEVAHVHDEVVGIRCTAIDLDSITHLRRLVELNCGDAAELQRELSALNRE